MPRVTVNKTSSAVAPLPTPAPAVEPELTLSDVPLTD